MSIPAKRNSKQGSPTQVWKTQTLTADVPDHPPFRRRFLITRHGERPDGIFGKGPEGYISKVFDENGKYANRYDINLPQVMWKRADSKSAWARDPNLSEIGYRQAQLMGRGLAIAQVGLDFIISSPSLRCVRTAKGMVEGYNSVRNELSIVPFERPIMVDPGLFEFPYFSKSESALPSFLTPDAYWNAIGVKVDVNYTPSMSANDLSLDENLEQFHERQLRFIRHAANSTSDGSTTVLTTHAPNFEPLVRQVCGRPPRSWNEFKMPMRQTPFVSMISLLELANSNGEWDVAQAPIPPLTHGPVLPFDVDEYMRYNVP